MTTLRERVKSALSAREPSQGEAAADLDAILARARSRPRLGKLAYASILAAAAAIFLVAWLAVPRPTPVAGVPSPPSTSTASPATAGVHLYLHVTGEPEDRALAIDLTSKGDRR